MLLEPGQLIRHPGRTELARFVRIHDALPRDGGWRLYVATQTQEIDELGGAQ